MQHHLNEFLSHGALPFVGRSGEADRLFDFWSRTPDANRLQAALLLGEAGIGKSRLLEEIMSRVSGAGGAVVHAKLFPEAATAVIPLVARSLRFSEAGRELLRKEPEETLSSVLESLRRLCRLRPTLLVVEDIHLLGEEALREFAMLLDAMADETLSVLCLARPLELRASGILERYLVEKIELQGLNGIDIRNLWEMLFDQKPEPTVAKQLRQATLGNGLAIRSALRGALEAGVVGKSSGTVTVDPISFALALQRSVELFADGLTVHLTPMERQAAEALACLGEVFARETAEAMIDNADRLIEQLIDKGILATTTTPVLPLPAVMDWTRIHDYYVTPYVHTARPLLGFTHTLLQKHLLESVEPDWGRLVRVIADELPLYSLVALQVLGQDVGELTVPPEQLRRAFYRAIAVAYDLDKGSGWGSALDIAAVAESLLAASHGMFDDEALMRAELFNLQLLLRRRSPNTPEYAALLERFMALTEHPPTPELATYRLMAHFCRLEQNWFDAERRREMQDEVEQLLERYPQLLTSYEYVLYMRTIARNAYSQGDIPALRKVEERLERFLASSEISEGLRRDAQQGVWINLLDTFDSPGELEHRWRLLQELESFANPEEILPARKCRFLANTGWMDQVLPASRDAEIFFRERGLLQAAISCALYRQIALASFGKDFTEVESDARRLCQQVSDERMLLNSAANGLGHIGLVLGRTAWVRALMESFLGQTPPHPLPALALVIAEGELDAALEILDESRTFLKEEEEDALRALIYTARGTGQVSDLETLERIRAYFQLPILRLSDLMKARMVFDLLNELHDDTAADHSSLFETIRPDVHDALEQWLGWLSDRSLHLFMKALVDEFSRYLSKKEVTAWRSTIDTIARERDSKGKKGDAAGRLNISMIGAVRLTRPDGSDEGVRGARMRVLLGLMVADRMLERRLSHQDFCELTAGDEGELEHPRKVMNITVYRLRELMGHDAVLTEAETPELNLERVRVDLLDANEALHQVVVSLRRGSLMRAVSALRETFDLTGGEVLFPTLYHRFFEAIREDFESRLHTATVEVVRALMHEGDAGGAEKLLRLAVAALPGDEEFTDLLREVLVMLDRRAEAERIK